jgi:two-component system sensor histidine kinase KdpD
MRRPLHWQRLLVIAINPAITLLLLPLRTHLDLGSVFLIQLVGVMVSASMIGPLAGSVIALVTAVVTNWFFVPPLYSLEIGSYDNVIAILIFVVVASASGWLLSLFRRKSDLLLRSEVEQQRMRDTEKTRTTLLASVGHDLRTPIAGIKATVSGLRAGDVTWTKAETADALAEIEAGTDRLQELVSNLLDMSRLEAGVVAVKFEPTELSDPLSSAIRLSPKLNLRLDIPSQLPLIMTDAVLLERALHNLLVNVHTHTPRGTLVEVVASQHNDQVRIYVIDHGPGLSGAEMQGLFARMSSDDGEPRRRGLGLAIVSGFVTALHGQITAATTRNGGLTVSIYLPKATG